MNTPGDFSSYNVEASQQQIFPLLAHWTPAANDVLRMVIYTFLQYALFVKKSRDAVTLSSRRR